jgi:hypothetical protein
MFSKADLERISPEELEELYLLSHDYSSPIPETPPPINSRDLLLLTVHNITLNSSSPRRTFLKLCFRHTRIETRAVSDPALHTHSSFPLPISYHSLLFDTIKLDMMEIRPYKSSNILGRVRVRLADLEIDHGSFHAISFPIQTLKGDGIVGSVVLRLEFTGPSFERSTAMSSISSEGDSTTMNQVDEMEDLLEGIKLEDEISRSDCASPSSISSSNSGVGVPSLVCTFSSTSSTMNSGSARKVSSRPGFFMSERTSLGIRELAEFGNSFFKFGLFSC